MTADYMRYGSMIARCHNPNDKDYPNYGGRGVVVADEWRGVGGFERYLAHLGPKPGAGYTVERMENSKGYAPGNVRWATPLEQGANKRNNIQIEFGGRTQHASAWARELGLDPRLIISRYHDGLPAEEILRADDRRGDGNGNVRARVIVHDGVAKTTLEWAAEAGISAKLLCKRLRGGWTMNDALTPSTRKF